MILDFVDPVMSPQGMPSLHHDIWITLFTVFGAGTDTDSSFPSSFLLPAPQSVEVLFYLGFLSVFTLVQLITKKQRQSNYS